MVRLRSPWRILMILLMVGIGIELIANLSAEILWFRELDYLSIFLTRLSWQSILLAVTTACSLGFCWHHLAIAQRLLTPIPTETPAEQLVLPGVRSRFLPIPDIPPTIPQSQTRPVNLPILLTLVIGINLVISLMVLYYSKVAIADWTSDFTLPDLTPPVPKPFSLALFPRFLSNIERYTSILIAALVLLISLTLKPRFSLKIISLGFSFILGSIVAGNWTRVIKFIYQTPFLNNDPQFHHNLSFYVFSLPLWKLLDVWLGGLFLFALLLVSTLYLQGNNHLSEGRFPGFNHLQLQHLARLSAFLLLTIGVRHWLNRYQLLYSRHEVFYGAGYTDLHVRLPLDTILAFFSLGLGVWLLYQSRYGWQNQPPAFWNRQWINKLPTVNKRPVVGKKYLRLNLVPIYLYIALIIFKSILSVSVELLAVQPNQLTREAPYIDRSIAATRDAFNLSAIQPLMLSGKGTLTQTDLENNRLTLNNIRLWDPLPLLKTNRQLQQIRLYYQFPDADLDRYTIKVEAEDGNVSTTKQQVLIAPRELDYNAVPPEAQTWVNEHLTYTHGYGFTLSPVNLVDQGGLPFYFVKDIGTATEESALKTSSELIRTSIPIGKPRLYFGELTDTYVMTNTKVKEFDFPSGQDNVYNIYDGTGGIRLGNTLNRFLFAFYLKDWQMLFTRNFNPDTKILFRRNINHRIRALAPFLRFDRDPYLVTANTNSVSKSTLYWIIDAYTTTSYYPYSDSGDRNFNYIRNSVKIVVDAYNGDVRFYVMDETDPLIQTWRKIFPTLFKTFAEMPAGLKAHIRYPIDLFSTQSDRLLTYHMTDSKVFYNREDQWQIPQEIYGEKQKPIAPYYLIMNLAGVGERAEEFVLSHVYTPIARNNLIALLFARSDQENYGKLILYTLPKDFLVYGPAQIEALINQDPVISEQITLWNREGSRVLQGNLLVIPIEQSLLYVEPLYLEAEKNSLPTLARVVVVYENQIAMSKTLNGALNAIFSPTETAPSTILRKVNPEAS
ncbi:MAG: UPF0182 family protein [Snowella sp.]|nr:UPF0182 family protein [Snowella sp.]